MDLELISFKFCPFAQRAAITLKHKQTPFRATYIEPDNPPAWLKEISPFGTVPLLRVDGDHVLFESAVIDEFLDEITPGCLLPSDPLTRGLDRSWIEFGTALLTDMSRLIHSQDADAFDHAQAAAREKLARLETTLDEGPYFNGTELSLVDFAYAPFFMRAELLKLTQTLYPQAEHPRITAWSKALLDLPAVQNSVVEDFTDVLFTHIRTKAPYAAERLGL